MYLIVCLLYIYAIICLIKCYAFDRVSTVFDRVPTVHVYNLLYLIVCLLYMYSIIYLIVYYVLDRISTVFQYTLHVFNLLYTTIQMIEIYHSDSEIDGDFELTNRSQKRFLHDPERDFEFFQNHYQCQNHYNNFQKLKVTI